jgi:palmitoyltransferase
MVGGLSALSPFALGVNPLVPNDPDQAGEDLDERFEESRAISAVEGGSLPQDGEEEEEGVASGDAAPLLSANREAASHAGRRSIMAKGNDGGPRWCKKCDGWKPDRTHHCRYCQKCSLKSEFPQWDLWRRAEEQWIIIVFG